MLKLDSGPHLKIQFTSLLPKLLFFFRLLMDHHRHTLLFFRMHEPSNSVGRGIFKIGNTVLYISDSDTNKSGGDLKNSHEIITMSVLIFSHRKYFINFPIKFFFLSFMPELTLSPHSYIPI